MASMGDRKKKVPKESFSSGTELRKEVLDAFGQSNSARVEYWDDDFQDFVEMDANTDLKALPQILKVRVAEN